MRANATPDWSMAMRKFARALDACSSFSVSRAVAGSSCVITEMIPALLTTTASAR